MTPEKDLLLSAKQQLIKTDIPVFDLGQQRPTKFPQIVVYLQNEQEIMSIKQMDCIKVTVAVDVYENIERQGTVLEIGRKVANLMQTLSLHEWPTQYKDSSMRPLVDNSLQSQTLYRLAYLFDFYVFGKSKNH